MTAERVAHVLGRRPNRRETNAVSDTYADGTPSLFTVLRPIWPGWLEVRGPVQKYTMGYPAKAFLHERNHLFVISAVEVASDKGDFVWRDAPHD